MRMGNCGSICDCLQRRAPPADVESAVENPFKPSPAYSSAQVYTILGKHPNGLKY